MSTIKIGKVSVSHMHVQKRQQRKSLPTCLSPLTCNLHAHQPDLRAYLDSLLHHADLSHASILHGSVLGVPYCFLFYHGPFSTLLLYVCWIQVQQGFKKLVNAFMSADSQLNWHLASLLTHLPTRHLFFSCWEITQVCREFYRVPWAPCLKTTAEGQLVLKTLGGAGADWKSVKPEVAALGMSQQVQHTAWGNAEQLQISWNLAVYIITVHPAQLNRLCGLSIAGVKLFWDRLVIPENLF